MSVYKFQQILETLDSILTSPRWEAEVKSFVDEYCITFLASDEENLLEHYKYYSDYCDLVDRKLQERLDEHGISKADFSQALTIFQQTSVERERFNSLEQLFAATDFLAFNNMCVNRNIEIESEASGKEKNKLLQCNSAPIRLKFGSGEDNIHEDCEMDVEAMSFDEMQVVKSYQLPHIHKAGADTTIGSMTEPITRICSQNIGDNGDDCEIDVEDMLRDEVQVVKSHQIPYNHKTDAETTIGNIKKPITCICSQNIGDNGDDCEMDVEEMSRDEVQVVKSHQLPHSHKTGLETTIGVDNNYFQSVNSKNEENKLAISESKKEMTMRHMHFLQKRSKILNKVGINPGHLLQRKIHLEKQRDLLKSKALNDKSFITKDTVSLRTSLAKL